MKATSMLDYVVDFAIIWRIYQTCCHIYAAPNNIRLKEKKKPIVDQTIISNNISLPK